MTDPDIAKLAAEMRARAKRVGPLGYMRVTSDDILALLDALDARWLDMSGAPRKRTRVLLTENGWVGTGYYVHDAVYGGWYCDEKPGLLNPTGYQLLPAPPADEPGGAR